MLIRDPKHDIRRPKEVKVKIPMGCHVRLHSLKVLTGKPISDTVTEALEAYFIAHPMGHGFETGLDDESSLVRDIETS